MSKNQEQLSPPATWPPAHFAHTGGDLNDSDAERGLYRYEMNMSQQSVDSAFYSASVSRAPSSNVSLLLPTGIGKVDESAKTVHVPEPVVSPFKHRMILFQLWFNTYRKFFAFIVLLNLVGVIMAALDRFSYAENHPGALVLGNILAAILVRNELFGRFLYLIANHGLRSVCFHTLC